MLILILASLQGLIRSMGFVVLIVVIIAALAGWIKDKIG